MTGLLMLAFGAVFAAGIAIGYALGRSKEGGHDLNGG